MPMVCSDAVFGRRLVEIKRFDSTSILVEFACHDVRDSV